MNPVPPCCRDPRSLVDADTPFARIIALDFYDGPTSGILQCRTCGSVYRFDMIDWDEDHQIRVFRLALLPPDALDRCVAALAPYGPPRWPIWVPNRSNLLDPAAGEIADRAMQRVLEKTAPAELVVAWTGYGDKILAARKVPAAELSQARDWFSIEDPAAFRDWFALLGLSKRPAKTATKQ